MYCTPTVYKSIDSNEIIEMTLVPNKENTDVFCVPTHHFCSLGCKMCHLTNNRLEKRMVPIQYEDFIEALTKTVFLNYAKPILPSNTCVRRTTKENCLISFMGVGEPLLNLSLVKELFLNEAQFKANTGYKKVGYAISTIFPYKNIQPLKELVDIGMPLKVHFSLHSPFSSERFNLLPGTSVSVEEALQLLCDYRAYMKENNSVMYRFAETHSVQDPVEIHYTLIKNVNDSQAHLAQLVSLLKKHLIQLKFILFNPIGSMERSDNLALWLNTIKQAVPTINVVAYEPPGREIGSSCGEFTKHYYHYQIESDEEYKEFKRWEKEHIISERGALI